MIEKNLHVNIQMRVCVCFKRRNSFRAEKKMPSNGIQAYFHNSIRWPSFWAFLLENNVMMIQEYQHSKETRRTTNDNETTVIRKYLVTFCSLSSPQIIRHICEIFGHFECAKILLSNGFYLHQMKDTKIDFTTDSSRRRIKDGTFIWRTPFVLLIIAKTMQTNK